MWGFAMSLGGSQSILEPHCIVVGAGCVPFGLYSCNLLTTSKVRVGQASKPGPWTLQLRNIVSAAKHIQKFEFSCGCHVWTKTSATKAMQDKAVKAMRSQRGHVVFSGFSKCRHEDCLQKPGKASAVGTMIFSKSRSQCLSWQWSAPLFRSARISDAVLQVGSIPVRVVAVYGYHSGYADHVTLNDALSCYSQ